MSGKSSIEERQKMSRSKPLQRCRQCGAKNKAQESLCWNCGIALDRDERVLPGERTVSHPTKDKQRRRQRVLRRFAQLRWQRRAMTRWVKVTPDQTPYASRRAAGKLLVTRQKLANSIRPAHPPQACLSLTGGHLEPSGEGCGSLG